MIKSLFADGRAYLSAALLPQKGSPFSDYGQKVFSADKYFL